MFTIADINSLDSQYFDIQGTSPYSVTLRSKCTGHEWHILFTQGQGWQSCRIYHRHHHYDDWHFHGAKPNLRIAVSSIRKHDDYQMGLEWFPEGAMGQVIAILQDGGSREPSSMLCCHSKLTVLELIFGGPNLWIVRSTTR